MKILVIHATAGAGHFKAAEALYNGIKKSSDHHVVLVDALDYTSPSFKRLYQETYFFLISKIPDFWGFIFTLIDMGWIQPLIRKIRRIYNAMNAKPLHQFLQKEKFDYIFATQFMPSEVAAALKRVGRIDAKLITVITDFDVHRIWLSEGIDTYTVASDWTKEKLIRLGIDGNKILVSGIPTDEKFTSHPDIGALKTKLGLKKEFFTVLIATGSFGIGPIEEIIRKLTGFQVLVICGHNKHLFQTLSQRKSELVKIFGLVDNMHELMAVSDVMVTKPGGLSISEALVSQLPLIFFNAIPGQEANNIGVLKQYGIGSPNYRVNDIVGALQRLKSSRDVYLSTLKKTKELARPFAVRDIIGLIK
jgi:processive 1,2-diacylglycerol beta-glucosyltransferase